MCVMMGQSVSLMSLSTLVLMRSKTLPFEHGHINQAEGGSVTMANHPTLLFAAFVKHKL